MYVVCAWSFLPSTTVWIRKKRLAFLQILCLYCVIKYCSHTIDITNLCSTYVYIVTTFCQITKTDLKTFKSLHRSRNGIGKTLQSFWKMMSRQRLARNQDLDKQRLIHMFIRYYCMKLADLFKNKYSNLVIKKPGYYKIYQIFSEDSIRVWSLFGISYSLLIASVFN